MLTSGSTAYIVWRERAEWGAEWDDGEVIDLWYIGAGGQEKFIAAGVDEGCSVRTGKEKPRGVKGFVRFFSVLHPLQKAPAGFDP